VIKARQIAAIRFREATLFSVLNPWIWRRNLDFAAIEDIHSIKRQIISANSARWFRARRYDISSAAAASGKSNSTRRPSNWFRRPQSALRAAATCDALRALAAAGHIEESSARSLIEAMRSWRTVEHRLQMVGRPADAQLPKSEERHPRIAAFLGFPNRKNSSPG